MAIALPLRATPTQPKGYYLSQGFHSKHLALDMVGHYGQPVYAVDSGRMFAASWSGDGWAIGGGYTAIVDHFGEGNRFAKSVYAHMSRLVVADNQYVMRGQLLGYAGSTGNSSGPHVHFSVGECRMGLDPRYYNNWIWLNPQRYMRAHSYANGWVGNGDLIGSWHLGRNTIRINAGVNLRSTPYITNNIVRTTGAATNTGFLAKAAGSFWNGHNRWNKLYDPISKRVVYAHETLGTWVT